MPPRTIFDLRYRPKGLEFLACTACNAGGKKAEQIAGFLSRLLYPSPRTREVDQELRKIVKEMINNHRDVLLEMFPTDEQLANFNRSYPTLQQFKPLSVKGPLVNAAMRTFAAKMGLALHYRENRRVVPSTGAVIVRWFSNSQAFTNRIPPEILQMVGSPDTLLGYRAGRAATLKMPSPETRTASPATRPSRMAFTTAFTAWPAAAVARATFSISSDWFISGPQFCCRETTIPVRADLILRFRHALLLMCDSAPNFRRLSIWP
jgi:hypothetical protein